MSPFHKLLFPMCAEMRVLEVTDVRALWWDASLPMTPRAHRRDAGLPMTLCPVWGHPSRL